MPPATPDRLVRINQLPEFGITYSRMTLWRKTKDGSFPAPIKLSSRCVAWRVSAIEAWIAEREATSAASDSAQDSSKKVAPSSDAEFLALLDYALTLVGEFEAAAKMLRADLRMGAVEAALAGQGARDVKLIFDIAAASKLTAEVKNSVCYVIEQYLAGNCTKLGSISDIASAATFATSSRG